MYIVHIASRIPYECKNSVSDEEDDEDYEEGTVGLEAVYKDGLEVSSLCFTINIYTFIIMHKVCLIMNKRI